MLEEKHIAIDCKKLCGTAPKEKSPKGDYLLNAYVTENSLFIEQEKVRDKENEIPAIPRLLDRPISVHTETEKEHMRVETRTVSIFPADRMEDKEVLARWPGIRILVRIETNTVHVSDNGKEECQKRYYISDDDFPAAEYHGALPRGHWTVENGLHWHIDITIREDDCRAIKKNAAHNLSILRKLALQVAKATNDRLSIRKRLVKASMDKEYLRNLLKIWILMRLPWTKKRINCIIMSRC